MFYILKFIILLLLISCSTNEKEIIIANEDDKKIFEKGIKFVEEKNIRKVLITL